MPTIKVKKGDETTTVEYDEIVEAPDGLLSEEEIEDKYVSREYFKDEVDRRRQQAARQAKEELAEDEEFIRKQIRKRGGEFDDDGNLKSPEDVDIDKLTEEIKQEILSEQVEPLKRENQSLKSSQLSTNILRAAQKKGVQKDALRPIKSGKSALELMAEDQFAYHPEKETWAQVDEDGNFLGGANGLRGIDDWLGDLKEHEDYQDWFADERQNGSPYNGNKGPTPKSGDDDFEQKKQTVRKIRGKE